ncbi:MAG: T9SS type A sorting domain-containing protein [Sphingobacteriaceae bacterium]|nr:T9SS type A sorting domain-containing protein [Sphingobacteriaceae bacterium]
MKKNLLPLLGVFAIAQMYAQSSHSKLKPSGFINGNESRAMHITDDPIHQPQLKTPLLKNEMDENANKSNQPPSSIVWSRLCGSMNVYGQLVSNSKPLQYNPALNAVSYVHRKSNFYTATPAVPAGSESGVIVAEVSLNWGNTWDSTCIWAGSTHAGRYPQGGIYNPVGNSNIDNAYIVGMGPTVSNSTFTGNFYASKKLAVAGSTLYNTTADPNTNAQQFLSFSLPSYSNTQTRHGWSRYGFSSTNDGAVRSLALIQNDQTTLGNAANMRGVAVVKGTFAAGTFNWTTDTMIPATILTTQGVKVISSDVQMAWNQDGTIGYVVMLGAKNTATLSNRGYQPIIFKTVNSGASWAEVNGINFNSPTMNDVTSHLAGVVSGTDTIALPYFNNFDLAVDSAGFLHIGATVCSGAIAHNDSLNYIAQYTMSINPGARYLWGHRAGLRPYLYDFIGDGTGNWKAVTLDSLTTEDPGAASTSSGYLENPWDPTGTNNAKVNMDPRIQLGRTPEGNYITFSWSETDTNFTNGSHKWNTLPNIKSRCLSARGAVNAYKLSATEINVSKPAPGTGTINPNINSRSTLHYMSPITGSAAVISTPISSTVDIKTPFTVTNSNPYGQLTNNQTWYTGALLSYVFSNQTIGVKEMSKTESVFLLYPNPATNHITLKVSLDKESNTSVFIINCLGQVIVEQKTQFHTGENEFTMPVQNYTPGIYFLKFKNGNTEQVRKFIVE